MTIDQKELAAGLLLIAIALFFLVNASLTLPVGTSFRMGPGYFPVMLSAVLGLLGGGIVFTAFNRGTSSFDAVSWRGVILITMAVISFGLIIPSFGLVPALFVAVMLSAFSSSRMTPLLALALAVGLTVFCALLFRVALELPVPLFGPA